ncbi:hypothetical protein FFLO_02038 [Filobasidium floriforme]|uniref:peptidylprolyl isomerase n=1 Tax=Filobasidium floriforme TaxID=5210 RepID=A0A8K0NS62_9TREE|nr:hypothetical protein FFLO_02038 [Filobasidium floriforme]
MSSSVLGKRSRSSASPPTGQDSGHPEAKESVRADTPVTSSEVPVEIQGQAGAVIGAADEDDDDDEEVGPMLDVGGDGDGNGSNKRRKKRAVLPHEKVYLEHLPSAERYYKSFMHRDQINFVTMTKTDFVITTSVDGHVKLWKKQADSVEFVKHYRASLNSIVAVSADHEGKVFATVSEGGEGRVFDVVNFDMINILKFDYTPKACCWVHHPSDGRFLLAISDANSPKIYIYDARGDGTPLHVIEKVHRDSVHVMVYSPRFDCVLSADEAGFLEYWRPQEPWGLPDDVPGLWQYKSQTDLFDFKKSKSVPHSIALSPNSSHFVTLSLPDRQVRVFNFLTGKKTRQYDESLTAIQEMQQAGTASAKLDDMEFGRRLAVERELERGSLQGEGSTGKGGLLRTANAVWDESGNFIIYPTLLGIKVLNTVTNRVSRMLGTSETSRWLNLALFQGAPSKKGLKTLAMAASANPLLLDTEGRDPTLFATAFKKQRFYIFSRSEPEDTKGGDRDIFNEKPTREEQTVAMETQPVKVAASGRTAVIHTTKGDIHFRLHPEYAPKAVENFVEHSKNGYYNGIIFHRIIKKFMLQTGDPLGDGTGGSSIWGSEFEDEFTPALRHDRPYTLSMANAGPRTNGSQFFITTVPTPWLDDKHTIFGRATAGLDVIHAIEDVRCDKTDKPFEDIKMVSIDID